MTIALRPHQEHGVRLVRASFARGHRRILLVMPTGAGKTFLAAWLLSSFVQRTGKPAAWFGHREELVGQAEASIRAMGCEVSGGRKARTLAKVVSVSGAVRRGEVPDAGLVVLDEAHHFSADRWGELPKAYGPETIILGLTATPERGDGRPLDHVFEALQVVIHAHELRDRGLLVPCDVYRPSRQLPSGKIAQSPVSEYVGRGLVGKRNVVFAPHIPAAEDFAAEFRAAGIQAHVVHGELDAKTRAARLRDFEAGIVPVLVNVYLLTEGWDCPATEVVTLARGAGCASIFLQMIGRGLRPAPGKDRCVLLDLRGASHQWGDPYEERAFSLTGEGITRKGADGVRYCRVCGALLADALACPECARPVDPLLTPEVTGERMDKFANIKRDTMDQRAVRLAKWIAQARAKGHNWRSALYRYKGAYGMEADKKTIADALALASGGGRAA